MKWKFIFFFLNSKKRIWKVLKLFMDAARFSASFFFIERLCVSRDFIWREKGDVCISMKCVDRCKKVDELVWLNWIKVKCSAMKRLVTSDREAWKSVTTHLKVFAVHMQMSWEGPRVVGRLTCDGLVFALLSACCWPLPDEIHNL